MIMAQIISPFKANMFTSILHNSVAMSPLKTLLTPAAVHIGSSFFTVEGCFPARKQGMKTFLPLNQAKITLT
jgi:hypothetical protein